MNFEVHNWKLHVGNVDITAISSSSVFLVGDNDSMQLQSYYDTPPDSYIVGSLVPLSRMDVGENHVTHE
ncbi:spore gernimation protein GerPD [Paraliobacillus sediminis]|uniref:spore gernimation protein GerPD n=1 Tax=Paraliobacillus sediminis TaxID=1885916 RepID=UPI000E3C8AF9|nr:spore gernimation protein GerPD [Paraliobacillus sediminis]